MLLLLFLSNLLVLSVADPLRKYPYVFLLDVGNEEIEKSDIQQIRLTIPGGSMAVKYPAIGSDDLIAHVRVTAIDYGTDLKANIVEGGPGFKYVVIEFTGNPGMPYDAVVSLQTVPDNDDGSENVYSPFNFIDDDALENDNNYSQGDTDVYSISEYNSDDTEVMQSSSNIYKYAVGDIGDSKQDYVPSDDDIKQQKIRTDEDNINSENFDKRDKYIKDITLKSGSSVDINNKVPDKYIAFKPQYYGGVRFYPQAAMYTQGTYENNDDDIDIPVSEDGSHDKYKDTDNHADLDYAIPVDY